MTTSLDMTAADMQVAGEPQAAGEPKATGEPKVQGPPTLSSFAHVSLPCRNLEEGMRFYVHVLGGELMFNVGDYAAIRIAGVQFGLGTEGCTFVEPRMEYPHVAFHVEAAEMMHMRRWLTRCGIPVSNLWTRTGVEALMFFRDPSKNLIELYCKTGMPGADRFPRGNARGGDAVNTEAIYYTEWSLPPEHPQAARKA